jgi:hypothetical protein
MTQRNGRRLLYTADRVRSMFANMRGDFQRQHFAMMREVSDLRKELETMRGELEHLRELRTVVIARQDAERELEALRRQRTLVQAWNAERDPEAPLH